MIQAIVTDIEGTTTSLAFVKETLFPYARRRLADFVRAHRHESAVAAILDDARRAAGGALDDSALTTQLIAWIDEDRKVTPLKTLQGLIWEQGYRQGDFTGHVYPDAAEQLRAWHARGIKLYVYSSGSVRAQQLLFGYSAAGDLTPCFSGYFDTTIGAKKEPDAYRRIIAEIRTPPDAILFLSDVKDELDAARAAGMDTCWLVRDGKIDPAADHRQVNSFAEVHA